MSEQQPSTLPGAVTKLGGQLITAMPAQFLMLCVLNVVFLLGFLRYEEGRDEQRMTLALKLLESCPASALLKQFPQGLP